MLDSKHQNKLANLRTHALHTSHQTASVQYTSLRFRANINLIFMSSCVKLHGCVLSALCKVLSISAMLHCNPNCFFFWLSENKETIGSGAVLLDGKLSVDREKSSCWDFVWSD